jgi:SAM-dependent methyltransferase
MTLQRDRATGPWRALSIPRFYSRVQDSLAVPGTRAEIAARYIRARRGDWVLDVGCGPADILRHLPDVHYVGIDRDARYLAAARQRHGHLPGARFVQMDVTALSQEWSGRFDVALAQGLLHHLGDQQVVSLLQTLKSLLKPGGRLLTVDPTWTPDQGLVARLLISSDRGRFVRSPDEYERLARHAFSHVDLHLRNDLMRLPYTHLIMECTA